MSYRWGLRSCFESCVAVFGTMRGHHNRDVTHLRWASVCTKITSVASYSDFILLLLIRLFYRLLLLCACVAVLVAGAHAVSVYDLFVSRGSSSCVLCKSFKVERFDGVFAVRFSPCGHVESVWKCAHKVGVARVGRISKQRGVWSWHTYLCGRIIDCWTGWENNSGHFFFNIMFARIKNNIARGKKNVFLL